MCTLSMVMDWKGDEWQKRYVAPGQPWGPIVIPSVTSPLPQPPPPTQAEIDEFRRLLDRAREYDKKHGEPDCELQEKKDKLKKMAKELGVDISFV